MNTKAFPAKILLFGEYTVTTGAPALAIPFFGKSGSWISNNPQTDPLLPDYLTFLIQNGFSEVLDIERFGQDVQNGLSFLSGIPSGYGLGSSGALVAALYDTYARHKTADTLALKHIFASLESFFHGRSSGIDPLVSYLKEPLVFDTLSGPKMIASPLHHGVQVFLIDSFQSRNTEDWVNHFQRKKQDSVAFQQAVDDLAVLNKSVITDLLAGDLSSFWQTGKTISALQFSSFPEFIPPGHENVWEDFLHHDDVFFKLCGAGGGGYTLGFAKNIHPVMSAISGFAPVWVS